MAVDEAILDRYVSARVALAPTARLYSWSPPCLSLGRRQVAARAHDPRFLTAAGIDLVRRPTGGSAVLHEHERTYAVVGNLRREPFPSGVLDTYRRVAAALAVALRRLGIDAVPTAPSQVSGASVATTVLCFEERSHHEIAVGDRKIVGAAQLRRRGAFLQHGSILLHAEPQRLARAAGSPTLRAGSFGGVEDILGRSVSLEALDAAIVAGFESEFDVRLEPGGIERDESSRAEQLVRQKYGAAEWTLQGKEPRASA